MDKFERFALSHFLCGIPAYKSYDEVIRMIEQEEDKIIIWFPFKNIPLSKLIYFITVMIKALKKDFSEPSNQIWGSDTQDTIERLEQSIANNAEEIDSLDKRIAALEVKTKKDIEPTLENINLMKNYFKDTFCIHENIRNLTSLDNWHCRKCGYMHSHSGMPL